MIDNRPKKATLAALTAILVLGLLLRLLGIGGGLPQVIGVDEGFEVHRALKLGLGEIDLERAGKGGFFYLLFIEYGAYFVWLSITGQVSSPQEFALHFAADSSPFWLIGRLTNAFLGAVVVYLTFVLGRRMYDFRAGLFGAALVAVSTLHVSYSHLIGVDIPMTLLVLLTMGLVYQWSDPESKPRPLLLGVSFGTAVMTKAPAIVLLLPIALANGLRFRGSSWRRALLGREILIAYGVAAAVAVIGEPGYLVELGSRLGLGQGALDISRAEEVYTEPGRGTNLWLFYLKALDTDLGLLLLVMCILGAVYALVKRQRGDLLLLAFTVPFYCLIAGFETTHLYYPRYLIPLIPLLGLLAGRLLFATIDLVHIPQKVRSLIAPVAAGLLLLSTVVHSAEWAMIQTREYTQLTATKWVEANVPPGSAIFLVGNPLADKAPNISLPLRNSEANLDVLIDELREDEPSKARFLELRKEVADGPSYDLRTVRHFEPIRPLEDYAQDEVRFFVVDLPRFRPDLVATDTKHPAPILESRVRLYLDLNSDPRIERLFEIDPELQRQPGPGLEIYRLNPGSRPGQVEGRQLH